jgi:hypothetical protein
MQSKIFACGAICARAHSLCARRRSALPSAPSALRWHSSVIAPVGLAAHAPAPFHRYNARSRCAAHPDCPPAHRPVVVDHRLGPAVSAPHPVERGLPVSPERWIPGTALIVGLDESDRQGLSTVRLWAIMKRFFETTATLIEAEKPAFAVKLRLASPHWMRHTHATHALTRGAQPTSVRDNLRHASISTTSTYLHSDEVERARQFRDAFKAA